MTPVIDIAAAAADAPPLARSLSRRLAAEALGAAPERCFVIEDSFNGIRAAHAAQMRPIMVPDMLAPTEEIAAMAEIVVENLHQALEYLKSQ